MEAPETRFIDRPDGRLSYDDNGVDGPLVIAAPGMGDLRHSYRHIRQPMADGGIRFVTMDLRGMGESSTDWTDLDDAAVASDYLALIRELGGGPAMLVGNSLSCASAVLAATDSPDDVAGIMLLGPFVRDVPTAWWQKAAFTAMLMPPWGRSAWVGYYRKNMYPGSPPPDHDAYVDALDANLREPGRYASFRAITSSSHEESERRLDRVDTPVVVVMGTADPDFPDPKAEARQIADIMGAKLVWSKGSGHYPQAETPDLVADELIEMVRIMVAHDRVAEPSEEGRDHCEDEHPAQ
ncbi:MAG: alpha/beta hydrolase [Acidimicrobiia bacterium]|nr:alpha/beta hydrolase [Acidimicrobiia bacterium]